MLKNYFKTAFRNLLKNKATSFINLFGLSIGMTAAVFIFLWVQNEISFNSYQPGKDNIYRITSTIQVNKNEAWVWEPAPNPLPALAVKDIPGVEKATRVRVNTWGSPVLNINNKLFQEKTSAYADKNWFDIFHYDFVEGNAASFGQHPFSIILTQSKAKKYFGDAVAVGKVIKVDTVNYTVQGVVKDNPINSSFQFDVIFQMDGFLSNPHQLKEDKKWGNFAAVAFLKLRPDANRAAVTSQLNILVNKNRTNNNATISLEGLPDMYFESDLQFSNMPHGNKKATYIFSILGLLLLVTACINYVNLTTAKASLRAKEVSVRKIIGAQKGDLFFQFIAESLTISLLALAVTLLLIQACLPLFNSITEKNFRLPLTSESMWRVLLGTLLFATLLNGLYPAALLSSFKPLNVFRGKSLLKLRDGTIRKGLVIFQFTLSMLLIVCTMVIYKQMQFVQNANPGYNISQIASIEIPYKAYGSLDDKAQQAFFASMKRDLQSQSTIAAVSSGGDEIDNIGGYSSGNADWDGRDTTSNPTVARLSVDEDFQTMFQLKLKSGHWFKKGNEDIHNYIINEEAEAAFNMHKPTLGQRFTWGGDTGRIIAVVKNFNYKSMHEKIGPMVMMNNQGSDSYFFIKIVPGNIPKALAATGSIWAKYIPAQPFSYNFLDDSFNSLYKTDIKTSRLIFIFSIIAIIISAMGLFGLATFTAERRAKEIGIRKILGATVQQITTLLSREFVALVLVAIVIASPLAWWLMNKWLQDFAYRINITAGFFITAGILALLIAVLSVSVQAIKTAVANPVKSLRTE